MGRNGKTATPYHRQESTGSGDTLMTKRVADAQVSFQGSFLQAELGNLHAWKHTYTLHTSWGSLHTCFLKYGKSDISLALFHFIHALSISYQEKVCLLYMSGAIAKKDLGFDWCKLIKWQKHCLQWLWRVGQILAPQTHSDLKSKFLLNGSWI